MARDQETMTYFAWTDKEGQVKVMHAKSKAALEARELGYATEALAQFRCPWELKPMSMQTYHEAIGLLSEAKDLIELPKGFVFPDKEKRQFWTIKNGKIVIVEPEPEPVPSA